MAEFNDEYYSKEEKRREKRRERAMDILAVIFCLIAAIGIWLFAANKGGEPNKNDTETVASQTVLSADAFDYLS